MVDIRETISLDELMKWRGEVIGCVFGNAPDNSLHEANRRYYAEHTADNSHVAVVASFDSIDCGCGGICFSEELPSPDNPNGRCAYLMNIYVREHFRNRGIAHRIIRHLLDIARKRCCGKIYLETTDEGRPVYLSLGFRDMQNMMTLWHNQSK